MYLHIQTLLPYLNKKNISAIIQTNRSSEEILFPIIKTETATDTEGGFYRQVRDTRPHTSTTTINKSLITPWRIWRRNTAKCNILGMILSVWVPICASMFFELSNSTAGSQSYQLLLRAHLFSFFRTDHSISHGEETWHSGPSFQLGPLPSCLALHRPGLWRRLPSQWHPAISCWRQSWNTASSSETKESWEGLTRISITMIYTHCKHTEKKHLKWPKQKRLKSRESSWKRKLKITKMIHLTLL